jgi:hypothetical protein
MLACLLPVHAAQTDAEGLVAASAARYVLRVARGLEEAPRDESAFLAIDLDGDGAVTEADFTGMLRLSVGLDAFDLPDRSMPVIEITEYEPDTDAEPAGNKSGGSSSDSDYWDKPWGPVPGALPKGETGKYAVNTNTGRFHYASCRWADDIYPYNRTDSNADRQDIIDAGYTPCKVCCP